jgi:hypothetical protein
MSEKKPIIQHGWNDADEMVAALEAMCLDEEPCGREMFDDSIDRVERAQQAVNPSRRRAARRARRKATP